MINSMLSAIQAAYPLTEVDPGEFSKAKVSGIRFSICQFQAEGLGNVSVMSGSGMFGLMKMDTLIVNPFSVDAPLFSYDRIHAMGNDTLFLEIFDTRLEMAPTDVIKAVTEKYVSLPDADPGVHWYESIRWKESIKKKGKKTETPQYDALTADFTAAYLSLCRNAPICNAVLKKKAASVYTEGLVSNGGPATDAFLKTYGTEKTGALLRNVLFGTGLQD